MRELDPQELEALRLAAEGKLRTPKSKEVRRRNLADGQLPTVRPKPSRPNPPSPLKRGNRLNRGSQSKLGRLMPVPRPRPAQGSSGRGRCSAKTNLSVPHVQPPRDSASTSRGRRIPCRPRPRRSGTRQIRRKEIRPAGARPARPFAEKPAWKKDDRAPRPPARFAPGADGDARPPAARPFGDRPAAEGPTGRSLRAVPLALDRQAGRLQANPLPISRRSASQPLTSPPGRSPTAAIAHRSSGQPRPAARHRLQQKNSPQSSRAVCASTPLNRATRIHAALKRASSHIQQTADPAHAGRPPFDRPRTGKPLSASPVSKSRGLISPDSINLAREIRPSEAAL